MAIDSSTVLRRPMRLIIMPVGMEHTTNHRNTIMGMRLASVSDSMKSFFT